MNTHHQLSLKRQHGFADSAPPLFMLMVYGTLVFWVTIFIASIIIPFRLRNPQSRKITIVAVILFWCGFYWYGFGSDNAERKWRVAAWDVCDKEQKTLPTWIYIDGFVDEGTILTTQSIRLLLSDRHLKFIEIKAK